MSPYDIIYTKTYALRNIPHTCAGPPLRWACASTSVFMLALSRNRADTIHISFVREKLTR
jgi:hypothetical protein